MADNNSSRNLGVPDNEMDNYRECFEINIYHDAATGCWIWTGIVNAPSESFPSFPVLQFDIDYPRYSARRYAYELHYGRVGERERCYNHCGNALCVNPEHSKVGALRSEDYYREKFHENILESDTGCWNWLGFSYEEYYPKMQFGQDFVNVLRWVYREYIDNDVPRQLRRTCNNLKCVNPYHLRGAGLPLGEILCLREQGIRIQHIAQLYACTESNVYAALKQSEKQNLNCYSETIVVNGIEYTSVEDAAAANGIKLQHRRRFRRQLP